MMWSQDCIITLLVLIIPLIKIKKIAYLLTDILEAEEDSKKKKLIKNQLLLKLIAIQY